MVAFDPLSVLVGVPVLGPVVAFLLWEIRDMRREHSQRMTDMARQHDAEQAATAGRVFSLMESSSKSNTELAHSLTLLAERIEHIRLKDD